MRTESWQHCRRLSGASISLGPQPRDEPWLRNFTYEPASYGQGPLQKFPSTRISCTRKVMLALRGLGDRKFCVTQPQARRQKGCEVDLKDQETQTFTAIGSAPGMNVDSPWAHQFRVWVQVFQLVPLRQTLVNYPVGGQISSVLDPKTKEVAILFPLHLWALPLCSLCKRLS